MLTSKQRAALRGIASTQDTLFQLGKEGITENFIKSCDSALTAREIIKIGVLKTAPLSSFEAGREVASELGAEFVASIGSKFVLYRFSKDKAEHIKL